MANKQQKGHISPFQLTPKFQQNLSLNNSIFNNGNYDYDDNEYGNNAFNDNDYDYEDNDCSNNAFNGYDYDYDDNDLHDSDDHDDVMMMLMMMMITRKHCLWLIFIYDNDI
ncbi:hypothetical protein LOAG_13998 [Loa loa]|uniref:Uncharacterized protein n=1 Tax=Loa loa TaxID=7209 RepID=A0A1S0TII6_LOALO|nr:hypothetical protein LOAG_13998 [Loa loa]EFO14520.1 hypothetical protein LOAG_13998 [Loa loa]